MGQPNRSKTMKIFVCFLIIIQLTIGSKDNVYDAKNCGIPQPINSAGSSPKVRRSVTVEHSVSAGTDNDLLHQGKNTISEKDDNNFMKEKIMGGRRAEKGELPWAILLRINRKGLCGGTLVSKRHVITAAHCFWNSSSRHEDSRQCSTSDMYPKEVVLSTTEVFVGGTCSSAGSFGCTSSDIGRIYRVARASYRTYFERGCEGTRDIAILQLTEDVPKTINHVCLPFLHNLKEIEDPYLKLRTFGWGRDPLNHFENRAPFLQIADLGAKLPETVCKGSVPSNIEGTFCVRSGQQHFCDGDSGGGVIATIRGRSYLMGVVSEGPDCDKPAELRAQYPQVCTDTMYYKKYINKWIGANGPRTERFKAVDRPPFKIPNQLTPFAPSILNNLRIIINGVQVF